MKYCTNCGNELADNAVMCPKCGCSQQVPQNNINRVELRTNRGLGKYIFLSIITFGIYGIVCMSHVSEEINLIASRYDGKKTMHYCLLMFVFSYLTLGIAPIIWHHRISNRIGEQLRMRNIHYNFDSSNFWGWGFFGALIVVGQFIYTSQLLTAMNLICGDYNAKGI